MDNKTAYIALCSERRGIPLFMQPWWLDAVCAAWDVAIARKGEHIAGAWAYPVENKMGVSILRNPVLTPYLGPHVFYPADVKESNKDSFEHETLTELLKQIPNSKVWHLAIAPDIKQVGLFKQFHLQARVQQTFLLDLKEEDAALLANMKEPTRRNIKQAEKEITITSGDTFLKQIFDFQEKTLAKKGRKQFYDLQRLSAILKACQAHNAGCLWAAMKGETVQAIVWQVWDDERSYYFMGGQNADSGSYKAMTLLLWHCIREAKKRGIAAFDFEGSMDEGVERFFRNFGGKRTLYVVLQKNESPVWRLKQALMG